MPSRVNLPLWLFALFLGGILILALIPPGVGPKGRAALPAGPARRVVTLAPVLSGYVTIDGGPRHIVGSSKLALTAGSGVGGLLQTIYPAIARVPLVGNAAPANFEEVMRLSPDALFVTPAEFPDWQRLGLPGLYEVSLSGGRLADRERAIWLQMGEVAGQEARAQEVARRADRRVQEIRKQIDSHPGTRPRVMVLQRGGDAWFLDGRYNSFSEKLLAAGATLRGGRFTARLDPEWLFVFDPDVLLITGMHPHDEDAGAVDAILDDPAYRSLRAIRSRRVYAVPELTFLNEPAEDPLLLQWLAEVLWPRDTPCGIRAAYRDDYRRIYGYSLSDEQIDRVLWLRRNRHSSGYSRFERSRNNGGRCLGFHQS